MRIAAVALGLCLVAGACSTSSSSSTSGRLQVVAAENFWGNIARQLGGDKVTVRSIITNPDTDPHDYEPTAADKATCDAQIKTHQIKVYVFNSQNSTPDVQAQVHLAQANGIAVVPITETLTPTSATFQDWQANQLQSLAAALGKA